LIQIEKIARNAIRVARTRSAATMARCPDPFSPVEPLTAMVPRA
jgi:hypothetical protein